MPKNTENLTPAEEPKKDEQVVLSQAEFATLMSRLEKLESLPSQTNQPIVRRTGNENRKVKVRFIDGKVVVGYGKSHDTKTVDGNWVLMIEVITEDGKKHEVPYLQFHNEGEREQGEIIRVIEQWDEVSHGKIPRKVLRKDEWDMVDTGEYVDLLVKIPKFEYVVRLEDGREFTLPQEALN